jgi:hypothetical protein
MKTTDFTEFGHDFTSAKSQKYTHDFICKNCKIRVHMRVEHELHLVTNYIDDYHSGQIPSNELYNLSCKEQQIKSLLE